MTTDPFDAYARLDPARNARPDWDDIGPLVVDAIDERAEPMTMQMTPPEAPSSDGDRNDRPRRPRRLLLAAAASLVAIATAAIVVAANTREEVPADDPPAPAPEPELIERTPLATNLADNELVWVGNYEAEIVGELGPADFDLTVHPDGTFETTATDQLCAMNGTWSVAADDSLLAAEAECDGTSVVLESVGPRPESLSGRITTGDDRSSSFTASYVPETIGRPLTDEELAFVGEYSGRTCGPRCDDVVNELRADGTFVGQGSGSDSFFSAPLRGHWEITEAGLLSIIGTSSGFNIRIWQPAYPDAESEGQLWSSSNGFGTKFEGTAEPILAGHVD